MLILRRKAGESILIGDEVKVTVIDINEGSIRLAVEAPKRIPVLRSELLQAADVNRTAALQPDAPRPQSLLPLLSREPGRNPRRIPRRGPARTQTEEQRAAPEQEQRAAPEQGQRPAPEPDTAQEQLPNAAE